MGLLSGDLTYLYKTQFGMEMNNCIGKDMIGILVKLSIVIVVLTIVCNVVSCRVNRAITKGITDEAQVTMPIAPAPTDSVSQARFEEALCQLQHENRERISNCIEAINGYLTLWMSLICAVCTLLPIASNLYYSHQMGEVERKFNEDIKEKMKAMDESVKEKLNELKKTIIGQQDQLKQEKAILHIIQMVSTLTLLCEMQQLFRQHNVFLTGKKELGQTLASLTRYMQNIQNLPDEEGKGIHCQFYRDLCFLLLCKFELLFNTYESVFGYPRLMELLALKDKVRYAKERYGEESTKPAELKQMVVVITNQLIHLFEGELKEREEDQSGQS